MRSAQAGGWKTTLPEAAVAQMESAWGNLMVYLGYELSGPQPRSSFDLPLTETVISGESNDELNRHSNGHSR